MSPRLEQIMADEADKAAAREAFYGYVEKPETPNPKSTLQVFNVAKTLVDNYAANQQPGKNPGLIVLITPNFEAINRVSPLMRFPSSKEIDHILPGGPIPLAYTDEITKALDAQAQSDGAAIVVGNDLYIANTTLISPNEAPSLVPTTFPSYRLRHATAGLNSRVFGDVVIISEEDCVARVIQDGIVTREYQPLIQEPTNITKIHQPELRPTGTQPSGFRGRAVALATTVLGYL